MPDKIPDNAVTEIIKWLDWRSLLLLRQTNHALQRLVFLSIITVEHIVVNSRLYNRALRSLPFADKQRALQKYVKTQNHFGMEILTVAASIYKTHWVSAKVFLLINNISLNIFETFVSSEDMLALI